MSDNSDISEVVRRLPPPIPGVVISIPIELYPAYMKLHNIEPKEYREQDEVLLITRIN